MSQSPIQTAPAVEAKDHLGNVVAIKTRAGLVIMLDGSNVEAEIAAIKAAIAGQTGCQVLNTIADRDGLTGMNPGDQVWVLDATGDSTVTAGAAKYLYVSEETGWVKTGEAESLDVVVQWEQVRGTEEVKAAMAKAHEHANKALLDSISTNEETGVLSVLGKNYYPGIHAVVLEADEEIPADMAEGGLVFQKVATA